MAIAFVKDATGSDAFASSIAITVPAGGFAAGNYLLIAGCCQDGTFNISSISDGSNTYTVHSGTRQTNGGTAAVLASGYLASGLSASSTITATLAGSTGGSIKIAEFSGLDSAGAFDQSAKAAIAFDTAFDSTATSTTTLADEVLFGLNYANQTGRSFTSTNGFTEIGEASFFSSWTQQTQYKIVSATGTYSSTATADSAVAGIALIATFKAPAASGTAGGIPQQFDPIPFMSNQRI